MEDKNALIYCRVSSKRQVEEGHGNESQEKHCRDYADSHGYKVEKVFAEDGVSGGKLDRPTFNKLIDYLDKNKSKKYVLIFDDLKRLARDVDVHFKLKKQISDRGSTVESPNFRFEDTPEGLFIEQIIAAQAQLEKNQNQRQVIQKMKARLELGYWPFCPPPGLINQKDPVRGKVLTSREPYASIFKEAIEKYADNYLNTLEEVRSFIVKRYEDFGVIGKLSLNGAFNILTEELYYGYIQYKPWGIPMKKGQHTGFIAPERYHQIQNKLFSRSRPKARIDYNPLFPLRGIILCSVCKKSMTGSRNKGRNTHYPNYWCKTKNCERHYKIVRNTKVHKDFEGLLEDAEPPGEIIILTKRIIIDTWNNKEAIVIKDADYKERRMREIDGLIKNTTDVMIKTKSENVGKICEGEIDKLVLEKNGIEGNLNIQPKFSQEKLGTATNAVLDVLGKPLLLWKNEDQEIRKIIVYMYFDTRPVYDLKTGFGTNTLALPITLMSKLLKGQSMRVEMPGIEPGSEETRLQRFSEV